MAEQDRKDREPWSPKIENKPVFTNSADFERGLGEDMKTPDIDVAQDEAEDDELTISPAPNPFIKPGK